MSLNVIKDYIKDKKQNKVVMPYTLDSCVQNADGTKTLSLTDIDNIKGDIDEHARRITNLENASKGILYDTITDSTEAYIKSIRSDAVDGFGMLDKIGGKSYAGYNSLDLGSQNWTYGSYGSSTSFSTSNLSGIKPNTDSSTLANILCKVYKTVSATDIFRNTYDMCIALNNQKLRIIDSSCSSVAELTTKLNGIMLLYEEANPSQIIDISVDKAICKKADGTVSKEITLPTVALKGINSTVYDIADFENNKVVRKVGSRDYQAGDESNPNYITDMTTTYYPLATATETTLSTDEIIIPIEASGSVTFNNTYGSPIPSDITYNIHTS